MKDISPKEKLDLLPEHEFDRDYKVFQWNMRHERRLSVCSGRKKRGIRMRFQKEMKQIFLRVAAGEVEPEE